MTVTVETNAELAIPAIIRTDAVLVAEDDSVSRALLQSRLEKWDLKVTTAKDGLQAWHELQKPDAPGLIILDWMMPGFSGIDLCRKIRARKTAYYPYVLLLTSRDGKQDLVEGLDAGADDYLIKPFNPGELRARLAVGRRILSLQSELLRKEEELRFEARHDKLTGLWNRGSILEFLEREVARSARFGGTYGILMVDIDHFKQVNDTYGHQVGDTVLRQAAQRLASGMRAYDWVGRYGGEEFIVLIPSCNAETAINCAERLRALVAAEPIELPNLKLSITVSIGVGVRERTPAGEDTLHLADMALYSAKRNGRNRVEVAWQSLPDAGVPHLPAEHPGGPDFTHQAQRS